MAFLNPYSFFVVCFASSICVSSSTISLRIPAGCTRYYDGITAEEISRVFPALLQVEGVEEEIGQLPVFKCSFQFEPIDQCVNAVGIIDNFEYVGDIGSGGYGFVYEMLDIEGNHVAVKGMAEKEKEGSSDKWWEKVDAEIIAGFMLSKRSSSFTKLHAAFLYDNHACLVMEKVEGGDLFDALNHPSLEALKPAEGGAALLPEPVAREIVFQVLEALKVAHSLGIELRDVKLENVMLSCSIDEFMKRGGRVKLIDLGLAHFFRIDEKDQPLVARSRKGTLGYMPPPYVFPPFYRFMEQQDVFSVGTLAAKLILGGELFPAYTLNPPTKISSSYLSQASRAEKGKLQNEAFELVGVSTQAAKPIFKDLTSAEVMRIPSYFVSDDALDFIRKIWNFRRMESVTTLLQHPWFSEPNDKTLEEISEKIEAQERKGPPRNKRKYYAVISGLFPLYQQSDLLSAFPPPALTTRCVTPNEDAYSFVLEDEIAGKPESECADGDGASEVSTDYPAMGSLPRGFSSDNLFKVEECTPVSATHEASSPSNQMGSLRGGLEPPPPSHSSSAMSEGEEEDAEGDEKSCWRLCRRRRRSKAE